jgi:hypothetical protein
VREAFYEYWRTRLDARFGNYGTDHPLVEQLI